MWNRCRRCGGERAYEKYKSAKNKYTKKRKEAETEYQMDIINKCKHEPKLFYSYVKSKTKMQDKIQCLTDEGKKYYM